MRVQRFGIVSLMAPGLVRAPWLVNVLGMSVSPAPFSQAFFAAAASRAASVSAVLMMCSAFSAMG